MVDARLAGDGHGPAPLRWSTAADAPPQLGIASSEEVPAAFSGWLPMRDTWGQVMIRTGVSGGVNNKPGHESPACCWS